jgi:hypothetical protein
MPPEPIHSNRKPTMSCSIHLRVTGGLIDLARVMRFLRRYSVSQSRVSLTQEGGRDVATILANVRDRRRSRRLATALPRMPSVLEAVISDGDSLVAHYFAPPQPATTTREMQ